MKREFCIIVVLWLCSATGLAQQVSEPDGLDVERFRPALDSQGLVVTEGGQGEKSGDLDLGCYFHYSHNPLVLRRGDEILHSLVGERVAADLYLAMGLTDWLGVGVDVPAVFYQQGKSFDAVTGQELSLASASLGDIRVAPKITVLREERFGLALGLNIPVGLPSGDNTAFAGSPSVTFSPTLVASKHFLKDRLLVAFNLGTLLLAEKASYHDLSADHEIFYRVGAGWQFTEKWRLSGEIFGSSSINNMFNAPSNQVGLEWMTALRWSAPKDFHLTLGGGGGLQPGWGTPNFRVLLGLLWAPRLHDADGDGVEDRADRCPKEPGDPENGGCPWGDKDQDGVTDNLDGCPDEAGPVENKGCPWGDRDGDGLKDNVDQCPDQPEDRDGFTDDDGCPDPDNDGDGIPDGEDRCPNQAGLPEQKGCPFADRDGDGVEDSKDGCPDEAGPVENKGCPWGDRDGDGIKDNVDKCPDRAEDKDGFEDEDGCPDPDNDKDGIPDDKDKCPNEPEVINGVKDDDGCPDEGKVVVIVKEEKIEILQKVHFATAKAVIMPDSFSLLDQVAQVLRGHSEIKKVRVEGHTDDRGPDRANQILSEKRAQAVRDYLVKRGGIDPARLEAVGYGESRPIADNKTPEGREANRRVEFTILETQK
jgi:outer membrane protein OmpA-like peptidoglycan-associated protein